jgi:hypothetical protein
MTLQSCHSGLDPESSLFNLDSRFPGNDSSQIIVKPSLRHYTSRIPANQFEIDKALIISDVLKSLSFMISVILWLLGLKLNFCLIETIIRTFHYSRIPNSKHNGNQSIVR